MDGAPLTLRDAERDDARRVAEIQHGAPGSELVGMFGSPERARRFGIRQTLRRGVVDERRPVIVACRGTEVVGFVQWSIGAADRIRLGDVLDTIAVVGLRGLAGFRQRMGARSRVDTPVPKDAFYIAEIHVDPTCRGLGIGGALLDAAVARADVLGHDVVSLTTTIDNPARRLYARHGFVVVDERRDETYERMSGAPGRVRMERRSDGAPRPRTE